MVIRFNDGVEFITTEIMGMHYDMLGSQREILAITISGSTFQEIYDKFTNNIKFSVVDVNIISKQNEVIDEDENIHIEEQKIEQEVVYDKSEYVLLGDIIIHPDSTIKVLIGKKTELENVLDNLILQSLNN